MCKYVLSLLSVSLLITSFAYSVEEVAKSQDPASNAPEGFPLEDAIQPRTEDSHWLYISSYFEDGVKQPDGSTREDVMQTIEINGVTCYQIQFTVDWRSFLDRVSGVELYDDDYSYYWEYFNEDGSYNYWAEDKDDTPTSLKDFHLTLPYPTSKGHSYQADDAEWEVLDDAFELSVQAGDFVCVVYETTYIYEDYPEDSSRERYYMAVGVGLVRWEMDSLIDGEWVLEYRDDLLDYEYGE